MDGSSVTDAALRQDYLERARELVPMLKEAGDEIEKHRQVSEPVVEAMVERGIFKMLLPKSIGGGELDPLTYTAVLEILAQGDGSTAWCLGQNSGCSMTAPYLSHEMAVEVFGGPRGILAWGPEMPGRRRNASRSRAATAPPGAGASPPAAGTQAGSARIARSSRRTAARASGANGRQITRTMLVPKSEATIIDNWQVLGLRGTGSDSYELKDHFVPEARTAIRDNAEERRETGPLYQFTSGMIYAMSFSHVSLGIARGAYDAFIEIARDKVPRGAKDTLRENNVIQSQVSQSRGEAAIGARLSARGRRRDVGRCAAHRPDRRRASPAIAPRLDLGDPPGARRGGDGLSRGRRLGDFREQPAGTPHARHPCRDPAGPGPPDPFRDGRPDADGPAAGRPDVPVISLKPAQRSATVAGRPRRSGNYPDRRPTRA